MILNGTYGKGGVGGLLPRLSITAPTGSTITVNGIALVEHSGTWEYNCPSFGTYSVVGTLNGKTETKSVIVDAREIYPVIIDYTFWLYYEGNECEDVTGGWHTYPYGIVSDYSYKAATFNSNNISLSINGTDMSSCAIQTNSKINLAGYSKLCAEISSTSGSNTLYIRYGTRAASTGSYEGTFSDILGDRVVGNNLTLSLTSTSKPLYILFGIHNHYIVQIKKLWLE